ncbi:MAG: exodeoxyribonuclease VII small subunit [Anaerolineales bacterium]|nr:exodeoxyribonuclease VII small subunit [Anaerolineales bacterium]
MSETPVENLSYEQALQELEEVVRQLEGELGDLDASVNLYARGQALAAHCAQLLEKAQLHVRQLGPNGESKEIGD